MRTALVRHYAADYVQRYAGDLVVRINGRDRLIGKANVSHIQVQQAAASSFRLADVFAQHPSLGGVFESLFDQEEEGAFREDLMPYPCNSLLVVERLKIQRRHRSYRVIQACIECLSRTFVPLDVITADCNSLDLAVEEWTDLQFIKVAGTPFFVRDNGHAHMPSFVLLSPDS